ncbi:hypothetical protein L6452_20430 [Arctium lappa]|uniref:Uncharacterized protein n=1 Tax=Arctium lappa TaxID=4217 RepID=A0ACB9BC59_ARCLA|nr:hypothetical protein L6452_20430 [Arctium lappa]
MLFPAYFYTSTAAKTALIDAATGVSILYSELQSLVKSMASGLHDLGVSKDWGNWAAHTMLISTGELEDCIVMKVEARIVVLAVLRMIKENYHPGDLPFTSILPCDIF